MENESGYILISKNTVTEKLGECLSKLLNYVICKQLFLKTNMAEIFFKINKRKSDFLGTAK